MNKKVALVSGSSRGIGKGIAKKLIENNYIVYINGRDLESLEKTKIELDAEVKLIVSDLSIDLNIKQTVGKIFKDEGRLDLVVANIGSGKSALGWKLDIEEYKKVFEINFFSAVSLATYSVEVMKERGGHIIFISSIAGCESFGAPIAYSSAKTALLAFSKNLSNEVAKLHIRVNSVSPGNVIFDGSTWDDKIKKNKEVVDEYIEKNVPLNGFATPQDIAKAVIFLEESGFVTGANIIVDGGQINKII
jgi:3-oxoacyl-[acyl-carrier protein] reductase